jgi:hypothetical protein
MLGSTAKIFNQLSDKQLKELRYRMFMLLTAKEYSMSQIAIYQKAFDYFVINKTSFDGATIVKDLKDVGGLDLDAMLHDYHYIVYNCGANLYVKWHCDRLYAIQMERKGKGEWSAWSRFAGLIVSSIFWTPYVALKRGVIKTEQEWAFFEDYKLLIN